MSVTAVVLTLNEEHNIGDCLSSLAWTDEQVVFDSFSTDGTVDLSEAAGAQVVQHAFGVVSLEYLRVIQARICHYSPPFMFV